MLFKIKEVGEFKKRCISQLYRVGRFSTDSIFFLILCLIVYFATYDCVNGIDNQTFVVQGKVEESTDIVVQKNVEGENETIANKLNSALRT